MMQPNPDELELLMAHEARYFEIWSQVTRAEQAWFLDGIDMPDYHSANRALRLRYANVAQQERGPQPVIAEIIGHYRERGLPVVVDVDPVAEALGFGRALRMRGVTPVTGSTLLMRIAGNSLPLPILEIIEKVTDTPCMVSFVPRSGNPLTSDDTSVMGDGNPASPANISNNETDVSVNTQGELTGEELTAEMQEWIDLAGCDEDNAEDARFWKRVAEREARSPDCRLYLAHVEGQPVGACQLFSHANWGLIDSVMIHPDFRRRGIASQLVARAVQDSQQQGNTLTYLYTERGGAGEQVYRRLGFEDWGADVLHRHIMY